MNGYTSSPSHGAGNESYGPASALNTFPMWLQVRQICRRYPIILKSQNDIDLPNASGGRPGSRPTAFFPWAVPGSGLATRCPYRPVPNRHSATSTSNASVLMINFNIHVDTPDTGRCWPCPCPFRAEYVSAIPKRTYAVSTTLLWRGRSTLNP